VIFVLGPWYFGLPGAHDAVAIALHQHCSLSTTAFPVGRITGATTLGGLEIPHAFEQSVVVLLAPHEDRTKQGPHEDGTKHIITPHGPWWSSRPLSRACSQQDFPLQPFQGHSGHMAEPIKLRSLYSEEDERHAVNFSQKSHLCRLYLR